MIEGIPNGWIEEDLKSIVHFQEGPGLRKWQFSNTGIPFLNINTLENERINKNKCRFIKKKEFENKYEHFLLNEDDIVVSSSGTLGKIAVVKKIDLPVMLNTSIIRFRSLNVEILLQEFLKYFLKSNYYYTQILKHKTGTAIFNYGPTHLKKMKILVPPLNEQKRIAAKLDKIMPRVEAVKERLERIPLLIKRFRQSVLTAAVTGKLTEKWREEHTVDKFTPQINDCFKGNLKYNIPYSWEWHKLGKKIVNIKAGKNFSCPSVPVNEKAVGLVKISAVTWNKFNPKETKTVTDSKKIDPELFIKKGDFLISRANTIELVGASVVVDEMKYKIMISDKVWRVDFKDLDKQYVNFFLKSVKGRQEIESRATGSQLSMRNISQKSFKDIDIPVPPLEEQKEIVRQVDKLFAFADKLEAHYQKAKEKILKLPQSILAKAFRGELVPQDPSEEPAHILLEKIKDERENKQKLLRGVQPRGAGSQ